MDSILKKLTGFVSKYRYVVVILLIGIVLMIWPVSDEEEAQPQQIQSQQETTDLSDELEKILGQIHGVGKVQVMLTVQTGEVTVYQYDDDGTVIITGEDRVQSGLIEKVESAQYRGAVIVCQGADSPQVRLSVIEAVSNATGLSSDRITVLKMK